MKNVTTKKNGNVELTIKIGTMVMCPITDADGEMSHRIGKLVDCNSRYATVELTDMAGKAFTIKVGRTKIEPATVEDSEPESKSGQGRDLSNFVSCRSASGRKSLDNNDSIAQSLRGKDLDFAYKVSSKVLGESQAILRAKYGHLNPGHQRMILGNRIRKA